MRALPQQWNAIMAGIPSVINLATINGSKRLQVTIVSGDVNGDRVADFEIEIAGIVNLRSGDFLL